MDWLSLKSGTDVRGTALGDSVTLSTHIAEKLGMAFAGYVAEHCGKKVEDITIALGRDSRLSGEMLLEATAKGIVKAGANAMNFGMCTTPAMFMSIITPGFEPDGSIMITASHHPWDKNGLKFFLKEGGIDGKIVSHLLSKAMELDHVDVEEKGETVQRSFLPAYKQLLADRIKTGLQTEEERPLEGLHIVVDAGNGAGGFYAEMLQSLGANTEGSQFTQPDGHFPNHAPNPENQDAMNSISNAVLASKADLGVIFDADCDRAAVVDCDGREINRNRLIALISSILLSRKSGLTIVTDSVTSSGLKNFIELKGGFHYRFKRGYRNVIDEAIRLNNEGMECPLAIETSGHAALQENHFLDDGMYLVTVLIVEAMKLKKDGKTLGSLIADLKEPVESKEIRFKITEADFRPIGQKVIDDVLAYTEQNPEWHVAPDNREGIRVSFDLNGGKDNGWFLLRMSVHDPVMPLNLESDIEGGVSMMLSMLAEVMKDFQGIDLSPIQK